MTENKSLIDELYTDTGVFDTARVVKALKGILNIQRNEHDVIFRPEVELKNEDKILAYALVKKLLKNEGQVDNSGISGKEVHEKTRMPKGTIDPTMQKLRADGFIAGKGTNYNIPIHKIESVLKRLENYIK